MPLPLKTPPAYVSMSGTCDVPNWPPICKPSWRAGAKRTDAIERSTNCWLPEDVSSWRPNGALNWPAFSMKHLQPLVKSYWRLASWRLPAWKPTVVSAMPAPTQSTCSS